MVNKNKELNSEKNPTITKERHLNTKGLRMEKKNF